MIDQQNKDKRIAWLSIFSSLCKLWQGQKLTEEQIQAILKDADGVADKLHKRYPMEGPCCSDFPECSCKQPIKTGDKPNKFVPF